MIVNTYIHTCMCVWHRHDSKYIHVCTYDIYRHTQTHTASSLSLYISVPLSHTHNTHWPQSNMTQTPMDTRKYTHHPPCLYPSASLTHTHNTHWPQTDMKLLSRSGGSRKPTSTWDWLFFWKHTSQGQAKQQSRGKISQMYGDINVGKTHNIYTKRKRYCSRGSKCRT